VQITLKVSGHITDALKNLEKKWKSYGKAAGRITLKQTSEEERRAVGGIIGVFVVFQLPSNKNSN